MSPIQREARETEFKCAGVCLLDGLRWLDECTASETGPTVILGLDSGSVLWPAACTGINNFRQQICL